MSKFSLVFFLALFALISSCNKDDLSQSSIPECIQTIIDNDELVQVDVIEFENELHFALHYETYYPMGGGITIVNDQCEMMCSLGGCIIDECWFEYGDDWLTLWPE